MSDHRHPIRSFCFRFRFPTPVPDRAPTRGPSPPAPGVEAAVDSVVLRAAPRFQALDTAVGAVEVVRAAVLMALGSGLVTSREAADAGVALDRVAAMLHQLGARR